jgi:hypothetical protein
MVDELGSSPPECIYIYKQPKCRTWGRWVILWDIYIYPPVIKHGNETSNIVKWCKMGHFHPFPIFKWCLFIFPALKLQISSEISVPCWMTPEFFFLSVESSIESWKWSSSLSLIHLGFLWIFHVGKTIINHMKSPPLLVKFPHFQRPFQEPISWRYLPYIRPIY